MSEEPLEEFNEVEDLDNLDGLPPRLPLGLPQEERYYTLFASALRKCLLYKPKFGMGRGEGLKVEDFRAMYQADPFYNWIGLDSPLMYAAHKAAGGMTSIYRQIGIGSQWIFHQIIQDHLGLSAQQAIWSYSIEGAKGKQRKLSLDGRIDLADVIDPVAKIRVQNWIADIGSILMLPDDTMVNIKGVVFEARQGYKSKDSKRQNADIANASKAYAHLYIPAILLFSTQIDSDVAHRYEESLWLILRGTVYGTTTESTYSFCRDVVGYDLADFFNRNSLRIRAEVEEVLQTLLTA